MDENASWYLKENIDMFAANTTDPFDEDFIESNMMHGMLVGFGEDLWRCDSSHFSFVLVCVLGYSYKWAHVRQPGRPGDVCRGQSNVVHLWAWHRGGHPRGVFRGEYLQEAEHNP